jgi:catechol 2,3-dioxygenase-like lactoylglutathione lyase family enzyme
MLNDINAVTLNIQDMAISLGFYADILGLPVIFGGAESQFSTLKLSNSYLNLNETNDSINTNWGRFIIHVGDVDEIYDRLISARISIENKPQNAIWNERYIHLRDPDGHHLSLAKPI